MPALADILDNLPDMSIERPAEWTKAQKKEAAYLGLHLADWAQTRNLTRKFNDGGTWHETNPILGKAPHQDKVDAYFALTGLAHYLLSKNLPEKWRDPFQNVTIGMEAGAIGNNINLGIKTKF